MQEHRATRSMLLTKICATRKFPRIQSLPPIKYAFIPAILEKNFVKLIITVLIIAIFNGIQSVNQRFNWSLWDMQLERQNKLESL